MLKPDYIAHAAQELAMDKTELAEAIGPIDKNAAILLVLLGDGLLDWSAYEAAKSVVEDDAQ